MLSPDLHDTATDTANIYLEKGQETAYAGWSTTDYIPVEAGAVYAVNLVTSNFNAQYCALYDAGKAYLKSLTGGICSAGDGSFVTFTPETDGYIRFSGYTTAIQKLRCYKCSGSIDASEITNEVNT